ncbi:MAG TPA: serine/threonine-protein kinase [Polyangiaceae bacterium]
MSSPSRSSMLVGTRLGAYELVQLLGQGGTASVFEGRHVMLGKRVAVKVLHEHLVRDAQLAARFLREGRVAAQLHHANVLEVMDLGREGDVAWLVMELLEGRDLRAELAKVGRLSVEDTAAYLLPIASALAYAHRVGAVHRDIKPANVFLAHDPRDQIVPKIVDFGLSKLEDVPESRPLTESEMVVGSVAYMAPEQTYGIGNAGPPADQFSFGCVLYECLTGRAPFRARSFFQLVEAVRAAKVDPPSHVVPGLPPAADAIVARAFAVDPADRFPSMRDLGAKLLALADELTREAWSVDFEDTPRPRARVVASPRRVRVAPIVPAKADECPPLPRPAGTSPFQIKGIPYRVLAYLVSRALPGGLEDLCDAIDDATLREFVRQPFLASSRYDVLPIRPLMVTLAHLLGRSFLDLLLTSTVAQARYDYRTVFRHMMGGATLDDWHERSSRFGTQYYTFGRFDSERVTPGVVVMRHHGVPEYLAPWYAPMQAAYAEETVRLLGGRDVRSDILGWESHEPLDGLPTLVTGSKILWE